GRIVGEHLVRRAKRALRGLERSCDMWERRIAVIATSRFIGAGKLDEALDVIDMVIEDEEDLLHKACGWMLREIWKKDSGKAEEYIANNRERMARTTLRYAIEKVPEKKRKKVLLVGKNKAIRYRRENDA
ncbi:MAG: DNA alkylation repair protein, partial [Candidatus Omnitrophica bacterium]|nr:DNA alkylation repair protein [Candidatus Omnitrophota bacterium]